MTRGRAGGTDAESAADLGGFGYAQQLVREMGGFGTFALSFSIISVLTGAITLYGVSLPLVAHCLSLPSGPVGSREPLIHMTCGLLEIFPSGL